MMRCKHLAMGLAALGILCGCAFQEDIYSLDHRLSALERRSAAMAKENTGKKKGGDAIALRGKYASMAAQIDSLQQENKQLSGRLEEMDYLLREKLKGYEENLLRNRDRMDRLATDAAVVTQRVDNIDQYLNIEEGQKPAQRAKPAASGTTVSAAKINSDQEIYNRAYKAFNEGRMDVARKGFQKLITTHPKSQHADNAQFWIGETYYREKWYEKAILEYEKVKANYPKGNKIPAALLKQGLAFIKIKEADNARLVFEELVEKFPKSNEANIAKQKLESL